MRALERSAWRSLKRATPLRSHHLATLETLLEPLVGGVQFLAQLWVGHSALLRANELLHLTWQDVTFTGFGVKLSINPVFDKC
jgi:hypothetical protein